MTAEGKPTPEKPVPAGCPPPPAMNGLCIVTDSVSRGIVIFMPEERRAG